VSKSRPAVANALRLLSLPAELMELVLRGELTAGSARAMLALKSADTMRSAAKIAVKKGMSVREVEYLVKKLEREESKRAKKPGTGVDYLLEAQECLTEAMCRRVTIKQGREKGRIEIEFYDQDDFDNLFEALKKAKW
jgi:ParB family chromosome partitioning protein